MDPDFASDEDLDLDDDHLEGFFAPPKVSRAPMSTTKTVVLAALVGALAAGAVGGGIALAARTTTATRKATASQATGQALDIQAILIKAEPAVVAIKTNFGSGSGVIVSSDGLIVTNNHVISGATSIVVTENDGTEHRAALVGSVPNDDVAVIRIDGATNLRPIEMGSSDLARVGDDVVAIGNALALAGSPTVTRGIVSAKERSIDDKANNIHLDHLLQTDAAINPGNSGGALLNAAGQLIGINVAVAGQAQNIGFALSVDSIKVVINDIKAANR